MPARKSFSRATRALVVGVLVVGSMTAAAPVLAHVVEVTTAVDIADSQDASDVKTALQHAVERVMADTIAFTPTVVALTDARVMGDKLLVRLLFADADGEQMLKDLRDDHSDDTGSASPDEEEGAVREIRI